MVEGSLWVYAQTRLTDYYAGVLSLRELANRFFAMSPEAPVWDVIREEQEKDEQRRKVSAVENVLARFKPKE